MDKQSLDNTSRIDEGNLDRLLNFGGNKIAAHHGKVGNNTVEYTTVFLHSDWLCFLWHGISTEFVWELKRGFVKVAVRRAVRLRECPLRELRLINQCVTNLNLEPTQEQIHWRTIDLMATHDAQHQKGD